MAGQCQTCDSPARAWEIQAHPAPGHESAWVVLAQSPSSNQTCLRELWRGLKGGGTMQDATLWSAPPHPLLLCARCVSSCSQLRLAERLPSWPPTEGQAGPGAACSEWEQREGRVSCPMVICRPRAMGGGVASPAPHPPAALRVISGCTRPRVKEVLDHLFTWDHQNNS